MSVRLDPGRQARRSLRRHPVHSVLAVGTLAVAIGGGTLISSLWDAIALRCR